MKVNPLIHFGDNFCRCLAIRKIRWLTTKKRKLLMEFPLFFRVTSGTRTHDIQNHNLTL